MEIRQIQIIAKGLYIPHNTFSSVSQTYHFCVDTNCTSRKLPGRNLHSPQAFVSIDKIIVNYTDIERANAAAIPMQ